METWVTKDLVRYAVATKFDDYPEHIIQKAKMLILDNLGCMIGGCYTNLGKAMLDPIRTMGGSPEATIVGGGIKVPTGWPSWTGTLAAILAANGFIGNRFILDGDNGFWIMAGSDQCDWEKMTQGLGSEYEAEKISFKPYSACRWQHAALDAISQLKASHNLTPDMVEAINVHSFYWVCTHEVYGPQDMVDAEFSMPYTATMIMFGYPPGPAWYSEDRLHSQKVLDFSKRVKVKFDKKLDDDFFKKNEISARVEIITTSGDVFEKLVEIPSGDPHNPLKEDAIKKKFFQLASSALTPGNIAQAVEKIDSLERVADITEVVDLLRGDKV